MTKPKYDGFRRVEALSAALQSTLNHCTWAFLGSALLFLFSLDHVDAQSQSSPVTTSPDSSFGSLIANSAPVGADVLLDGKMAGRTPIRLTRIPAGAHTLTISKSGFCDFTDTISFQAHESVLRDVQLDSACGLKITSTPDSAGIYIDNIFFGKSPARISNLRPGWREIKVTRRDYAIWQDRVFLAPGSLVAVNANMKSKFAILDVEVYSQDVDLFLDGTRIGTGSINDYMIPSGWHEISAAKVPVGDTVREKFFVGAGERSRMEAQFAVPSRRAFFASLLVPGLGQMIDGASKEGLVLMGGFAASCIFSIAAKANYNDKTQELNHARERYSAARTEDEAKIAGDALSSKYDEARSAYRVFSVGIGSAIVVYAYSLVDAFFNHSTRNIISPISLNVTNSRSPLLSSRDSHYQLTMTFSF